MRGGRVGGAEHVASRAARARAERLWHETVAPPGAPESNIARPCTPADDNSGSDDAHLPLSPSPEGGGGTQAAPPVTPSPPPSAARRESEVSGANARRLGEMERVAERDREKWGRVASREPRHPLAETTNDPPLPGGPATRKLRALWISAFHLGLTPGPLGRRPPGVAPPPDEPRLRHLPDRRRSRPRRSAVGGLARARRRRGLAAAPLPRPERAGAGDPPPPGAGAGGAMAPALPPAARANREPGGAWRLRRPLRRPRPRRLPPRTQTTPRPTP